MQKQYKLFTNIKIYNYALLELLKNIFGAERVKRFVDLRSYYTAW